MVPHFFPTGLEYYVGLLRGETKQYKTVERGLKDGLSLAVCQEPCYREMLGLGVDESKGFPPCIFQVKAHLVGVRSLTGLGKPQCRGATPPAAAQFIVEGKLFSSQICACNLTAALHVGCGDGPGRPVLLPRMTAKRVWPQAAN